MPSLTLKTLRYKIGEEVVAEVPLPLGPHHLSREVFLGGVYCECSGSVDASEPDVMVFDCRPFQVQT